MNRRKIVYHDIFMTNIQLHTTEVRKPKSFLASVLRTIRNKKPGRAYSKNLSVSKEGKMEFAFPFSTEKAAEIEKAEREGKVIRFWMPKGGLPIYLGKDFIERLDAEKKRIWNRI